MYDAEESRMEILYSTRSDSVKKKEINTTLPMITDIP